RGFDREAERTLEIPALLEQQRREQDLAVRYPREVARKVLDPALELHEPPGLAKDQRPKRRARRVFVLVAKELRRLLRHRRGGREVPRREHVLERVRDRSLG